MEHKFNVMKTNKPRILQKDADTELTKFNDVQENPRKARDAVHRRMHEGNIDEKELG